MYPGDWLLTCGTMTAWVCRVGVEQRVEGLNVPSFWSSNDPEDFTVHALLDEHVRKFLDQWAQPMLGPVGKMLIEHQSLAKQRMGAGFDRIRLQPSVVAYGRHLKVCAQD